MLGTNVRKRAEPCGLVVLGAIRKFRRSKKLQRNSKMISANFCKMVSSMLEIGSNIQY